jgi:hypothetical protein
MHDAADRDWLPAQSCRGAAASSTTRDANARGSRLAAICEDTEAAICEATAVSLKMNMARDCTPRLAVDFQPDLE